MIKWKCPHCGDGLEAMRSAAGLTAQCPTCSSAVDIPRSKTRAILLGAFALVLVSLASFWGFSIIAKLAHQEPSERPSFSATPSPTPPPVSVSGQVFIVTRGGEAIRLPLCDVYAFDPKRLKLLWRVRLLDWGTVYLGSKAKGMDDDDVVKFARAHPSVLYRVNFIFSDASTFAHAATTTDADGRFTIKCHPGSILLVSGSRPALNEYYGWAFSPSESEVQLTNRNCFESPKDYLDEIHRLILEADPTLDGE